MQTAWRIDEKRRIPYARTESVLLGLLEDDLPPLIKLYGVTNHTGRQRLVRRHDAPQLDRAPLLPDSDTAEQRTADVDTTDPSTATQPIAESPHSPYSASEFSSSTVVTDTLSALYDRMMDSYLEDIMLAFHKQKHADVRDALCVKTIRACKKGTTFEPFRRPRREGQNEGHTAEPLSHVEL